MVDNARLKNVIVVVSVTIVVAIVVIIVILVPHDEDSIKYFILFLYNLINVLDGLLAVAGEVPIR